MLFSRNIKKLDWQTKFVKTIEGRSMVSAITKNVELRLKKLCPMIREGELDFWMSPCGLGLKSRLLEISINLYNELDEKKM